MTRGESQRQVHAVQFEQDRVALFVELATASSLRIREKQGVRAI
jgi:hypothetical protein